MKNILGGLAFLLMQSDLPLERPPLLPSARWFFQRNAEDSVHITSENRYNITYEVKPNLGPVARFNGSSYLESPPAPHLSVNTNGFTVSFWFSPSTENFRTTEPNQNYIYLMGKGEPQKHEWAFRMYNKNSERPQRISFYVFNPEGGLGAGSYVQEPVQPGEWVHIVGVVDRNYTYIYKNGALKKRDNYLNYPVQGTNITVNSRPTTAPFRIGTRDKRSFFEGLMHDVRIYPKALSAAEIEELYTFTKHH